MADVEEASEEVEEWSALRSTDQMGGSGGKEDNGFADKEVEMTMDVSEVKVDEIEGTGADRRESNILLRLVRQRAGRERCLYEKMRCKRD